MDECPQTLDDHDGFTHECIHDKGHDQMHECVCHLMWDDIDMKSALRGLNQTFGLACPIMWPAVTDCKAWGAPGPHGCNKKPGHDGRCQCACGRYEPSRTENVETSTVTDRQGDA